SWTTWGNLRGLRAVLDDAAADRLYTGAVAMTICAVLLLITAVLRFSFRRGGRPTGVLLVLVMAASVAVPLGTRGQGAPLVPSRRSVGGAAQPALAGHPPAPSTPAVRMLLLDGASLGFILQRVAAGQLPNFGKIVDRGAMVPMATLKPTQPEPVWAAAATGKYPTKNGVRSSFTYRASPRDADVVTVLPDYCFTQGMIDLGFVIATPVGAGALRARPFWDILESYEYAAGIVRWPLTTPARPVRGFLISDQFEDASRSPLRLDDLVFARPTTAAQLSREAFDATQFKPWPEILRPELLASAPSSLIAGARWDRSYRETLTRLNEQFAVSLTAIRYTGIDMFSHAYFAYTEQAQLSSLTRNVTHEEQKRFGGAVDDYYRWIDEQVVGPALAGLAPGDLLLVVSGFGMNVVSLPTAILNRVLPVTEQSGTHDDAPEGFLMAYGVNVSPGKFPRGSIVDVAPTVLYYMGVPIGRDMDGFARTDIFQRPFTLGRPMTFIATHEK
ncbi:MAG: alkaline phosphatase family protein, partial [Acidobacteriota bacterium]